MYRIDGPTAAGSLPAPAAVSGTPGFFTDGDPGTSTPATTVTGDWANMIQEELIAVVVAGGLTPGKTSFTQVRDAINQLISNAVAAGIGGAITGADGTDGYFVIGVWIIMYGSASVSGDTTATISLPTTFPTACRAAVCNGANSGLGNDNNNPTINSWSNSSVAIANDRSSTVACRYIAVGK